VASCDPVATRIACAVLSFSVPRRPPTSTLFPYTTLFRSDLDPEFGGQVWLEHRHERRSGVGVDARQPVDGEDVDELTLRGGHHRSEEHTSELQSRENLVCRLLLEKKKNKTHTHHTLPFRS